MKKAPTNNLQKISEKSTTITLRNAFYSDHQFLLYLFILFLIACISGLGLFVFYQILLRPTPEYFQAYEGNKLFTTTPLTEKKLTDNELLQFVTDSLITAYSYNYINYNDVFNVTKKNFSPKGFQQYQSTLRDSRTLQAVIQRKMVVSATPMGAPIILKSAPLPPRNFWAWRVELPMQIMYQNSDESLRQSVKITVLIERVPIALATSGVMISQVFMHETRMIT